MPHFSPIFLERFYQRLLQPNGSNPVRNRADSLLKVFNLLDELSAYKVNDPISKFNILETGCMRADHGELCFGDDGCSTYIFDAFVNACGGTVTSVDISQENTDYARKMISDRVQIVCADSVKFLYSLSSDIKFDLVYLDSYDVKQADAHPAQLHALKELTAVLKNTHKGSIVVVDDANPWFLETPIGKGNYVKEFMQDIGAEIVYEGYQIVFKMP